MLIDGRKIGSCKPAPIPSVTSSRRLCMEGAVRVCRRTESSFLGDLASGKCDKERERVT